MLIGAELDVHQSACGVVGRFQFDPEQQTRVNLNCFCSFRGGSGGGDDGGGGRVSHDSRLWIRIICTKLIKIDLLHHIARVGAPADNRQVKVGRQEFTL